MQPRRRILQAICRRAGKARQTKKRHRGFAGKPLRTLPWHDAQLYQRHDPAHERSVPFAGAGRQGKLCAIIARSG